GVRFGECRWEYMNIRSRSLTPLRRRFSHHPLSPIRGRSSPDKMTSDADDRRFTRRGRRAGAADLARALAAHGAAVSDREDSGGAHNQAAPPFDFLARAFARVVSAMGARLELTLHHAGFYPAGGASFTAEIHPAERLEPVDLTERGRTVARSRRALVSNLPFSI